MFKSDPSFFLKFYSCSDLTSLFLIIFPVLGGFFLFCLEDVFVITDVTYYIFTRECNETSIAGGEKADAGT